MKHSYESTSEFIKELIEMTQQGSHTFNGMMSKDGVIGYLQVILSSIEPIESKATVYDTKEVQVAIECDRIERKLIELVGFIEIFTSITIKTLDGRCRVTLDGFKQHKEFLGQTKFEALIKALEWAEGGEKRIIINREWAMPNSNTFEIKPIKEIIHRHLLCGIVIDPFANKNKIANITNDLDSQYNTNYNLDATDFFKIFENESVDMALYDPPYSPRQVSECYKRLGKTVNMQTTQSIYWTNHKKEICRIIKPGGKVITFGWNSGGIGKKYGFEIIEILIVPHGGWHNDTIVVVEKKIAKLEY